MSKKLYTLRMYVGVAMLLVGLVPAWACAIAFWLCSCYSAMVDAFVFWRRPEWPDIANLLDAA